MSKFQDYMSLDYPHVSVGSDQWELMSSVWHAAIIEAGKRCDVIADAAHKKYKGIGEAPSSERGDPHDQGRGCGAEECADAVRRLLHT